MHYKIAYLGNPADFLIPFGNNVAKRILAYQRYFDYAGGIALKQKEFEQGLTGLSAMSRDFVKHTSKTTKGIVHLRSNEYYLNFPFNNNSEGLKSTLPKLTETLESILQEADWTTEQEHSRLIYSALLDRKRHYSLCLLNAYYRNLFEREGDLELFSKLKEITQQDIKNLYAFLLNGQKPTLTSTPKEALVFFEKEMILPVPAQAKYTAQISESIEHKLICREMDHPFQIILFAGQLLREDQHKPISFIVNPLFGAAEIGYAIQSIYNALKTPKVVEEVFFVHYSRYSDNRMQVSSLESCVPAQLRKEPERLRNSRILIVDDNSFKGKTLYHLKQLCKAYTPTVGVAAIERLTDLELKRSLKLADFSVKPISKIRYVAKVLAFIGENNIDSMKTVAV